jgi:peptidoglycan/LPS O-acetylase OafA/YrhL
MLPQTATAHASVTAAKPYFPALTGLRAVAAWLIFLYHTNPFARDGLPGSIISEFHVGVALFFVLSGFLICARYNSRIVLSWQWLSSYVLHRFARIYPLYFLLTCLFFVIYQFAPQYDSDGLYTASHVSGKALIIGMNLTLVRSWFSQFRFTGIYTGWTLTVEEFFYLLAPFLILSLRHHLARLLVYVMVFLVIGCALVALPAPWHPFEFLPSYQYMLSVSFFGRCFEFLAGIGLGLLIAANASPLRWCFKHISCTAVGIAWVVSCLALLVVGHALPWQSEWTSYALIFVNNIVLIPGLCLLLYGLIYENSYLQRLLGSPPFDVLGKASYALYLIHAGLLDQFISLHITHSLPLRFLIINLLAIMLYRYVEYPLHKKLVLKTAIVPLAEGS